ncbi:response regulator [bacterium]|nr:response regulator [bacterium]
MQDGKHLILCIDDDPDIRFFLETVLAANGFAVALAASGEEGLKVYKEVEPDLVIVDLMMEEVDAGTNFVKEVKAIGGVTPMYMLSSIGDSLTQSADYASLGLSGVLQKPIDSDRLLNVIAKKLG